MSCDAHWENPDMKRLSIIGVQGWLVACGFLVVAVGVGVGGGLWISSQRDAGSALSEDGASAGATTKKDVWYTCGMHPQVLQREPGDCPICGMKLTPRKDDTGDEEEAASGPEQRKILYWRAPMNPGFISDSPGKSPMGMDLVPVYADAGETTTGSVIRIDPVTIQNMGIRTARIRRGPLIKVIRTLGRVDYDEQRVVYVDTKISGWIENLYVDETGQEVRKGDPLFSVYSPELFTAQTEYIQSLHRLPKLLKSTSPETALDAQAMVEAAKNKLKYYDVSDAQINLLEQTGKPEKAVTIYSPADGIVTEKMANEGMQIRPGMKFYTIADLSRVWVYVDIYEYQLPWIRVGQDAVMVLPYVPDKVFRGKVVYIYPYLEKETRVIKVRLEFDNPTLELKPEMYANVTLEAKLRDNAILIPREAYIDSGRRKLAFVDIGKGKFEPRDIQTGVEGEGEKVEVLYGLDAGEVVVTSGQFLLDAESKLKEAVAKMMEAKKSPVKLVSAKDSGGSMDMGPNDGTHSHGGQAIPPDAAYACPMDKHPDQKDPADRGPYFSSTKGKCPRCGMRLKPIDKLDWAVALRAAGGGDVAYTCPDHPHVFSEEPGQCPRDGKDLQPFKVMYTCSKREDADTISASAGVCPHCGEPLVAYRGPWLSPKMAKANTPPDPSVAAGAAYHCKMHPLVYSDKPGRCTICGAPLVATETTLAVAGPTTIPAGTIYVCPMHPKKVVESHPGTCPICAMQLVPRASIVGLQSGPQQIRRQVDYITEHYLALQGLLASDKSTDAARHALGIVDAAESLAKQLGEAGNEPAPELAAAVEKIHAAALKIRGKDIANDRAQFGELSAAERTLMKYHRPDRTRWPKLYIFHCPMSKADWIQTSPKLANPYYGFKMLDCGKPVETK